MPVQRSAIRVAPANRAARWRAERFGGGLLKARAGEEHLGGAVELGRGAEAKVVEGEGGGDEVRRVVATEGGAEAEGGVGREGIGTDAGEEGLAGRGKEGSEVGEIDVLRSVPRRPGS